MAKVASGISRRELAKQAGAGLACAFGAGAMTTVALAQQTNPTGRSQQRWTAEYWAHKGQTPLYLYRKRATPPHAGEPALPVLVLAHGSSVSGRTSFDISVPGAGEYSMMNVFADAGFDTWAIDFAGYGRSVPSSGNSNVHDGVEDLQAAVPLIKRETGQSRLNFYGESSGALRVGSYAMAEPQNVQRLVLAAFTYTGKGSPTLAKRAEQAEFFRTHDRRPRDRDMILSIYTRDKPGTTDPRVADATAAAELKYGDSVPTGTYLDMTTRMPVVLPEKVTVPVLVVQGQYDGNATLADLADFYLRLPNADRQFAVVPNAAHAVSTSYNRAHLWHIVRSFLSMPATEPLHPPQAT